MAQIFRHFVPRHLIFLACIEVVVIGFALIVASFIRLYPDGPAPEYQQFFFWKLLFYTISIFLGEVTVGLYARDSRERFALVILKIVAGLVLSFFALATIYFLIPVLSIGRGVLAISLILTLIGLVAIRLIYALMQDTKIMDKRILVIGTEDRASQVTWLKRKNDWRGATLVGFLRLRGDQIKVPPESIIQSNESLLKIIEDYGIDEIVIAVDEHHNNYPVEELISCKMKGIEVTELSRFFEVRSGRIQVDSLSPERFVFIEGFSSNLARVVSKRALDITVSTIMLLLTLPIYPILIVLIKKESGWAEPVFYSQTRVGQGEVPFTIWKFRSMVVGAEKSGPQWASKNDTRVTKIGKIMRKTRLDELPQLWNVLKGDMSFVGPRPERPEFVDKLAQQIPYFRMRHRVKPGITGWAQVSYPYGDTVRDAKEKLQFDLYYIKNYSIFLDLAILAQTAQVILWQKGSR